MAIRFHPTVGTVLICDFSGLKEPEMVKRRPVVVISPRLRDREGLCAVVPLSTTQPNAIKPYHHRVHFEQTMPEPYTASYMWAKCDMVYTFSWRRLTVPHSGKDDSGKRITDLRVLDADTLKAIQQCVKVGLGLTVDT